ncbi:SCP-like protein [Ancylostoma duodenale]|uniref:SCP-like protein n=1 Tax=Ancylostoma duodenale TaxID=51022 RepID=A0A0C2G5S5_9BILA|nr:SCP-like protein [Ancylostoma duodenale]
MAKLNLIALAIASLLPALCEGKPVFFIQPLCPGGYLDKGTIEDNVLKLINTRRQALAQGTQKNGSGGKPKKLPPATNMTKISWSCDLEQKAVKTINGNCVNQASPVIPNNGEGLADGNCVSLKFAIQLPYSTQKHARFSDNEYVLSAPELGTPRESFVSGVDYGNTVENAIQGNFNAWLKKADFNPFPVTTKGTVISYPTYNGDVHLWPYSNLVRATNTEIGCVLERCPPTSTVTTKLITLYCVLNGK